MTELFGLAWLGKVYIVMSQSLLASAVKPGGNDRIVWFGLAS